jgi:hypothetical protein
VQRKTPTHEGAAPGFWALSRGWGGRPRKVMLAVTATITALAAQRQKLRMVPQQTEFSHRSGKPCVHASWKQLGRPEGRPVTPCDLALKAPASRPPPAGKRHSGIFSSSIARGKGDGGTIH